MLTHLAEHELASCERRLVTPPLFSFAGEGCLFRESPVLSKVEGVPEDCLRPGKAGLSSAGPLNQQRSEGIPPKGDESAGGSFSWFFFWTSKRRTEIAVEQ